MIEQTLHRDARPGKNRFATEDLRILRNNAAHEQNYALETQSIQANITDLFRHSFLEGGPLNNQLSTINCFDEEETCVGIVGFSLSRGSVP
jgi:hypothetical protein